MAIIEHLKVRRDPGDEVQRHEYHPYPTCSVGLPEDD